jgi:hypothetical protein
MSIPQVLGALLLIGCAAFMAIYVTFLFFRRLRGGDRSLKSFGAWLRDLFDAVSGLG